jgi:hypothetical protein
MEILPYPSVLYEKKENIALQIIHIILYITGTYFYFVHNF